MARTTKQRPITRALEIVRNSEPIRVTGVDYGYGLAAKERDELLVILSSENAASGTTDKRSAERRRRTIARKSKSRRSA